VYAGFSLYSAYYKHTHADQNKVESRGDLGMMTGEARDQTTELRLADDCSTS